MRSGRFWQLAEKTREAMQRMLAVLYRRLSELQRRAVMRFAGAFLAMGLLAAPLGAETVTFEEQTGEANPFSGATSLLDFQRAALVFADVDADGDQDAVVGASKYGGNLNGSVLLYRKSGLSLVEDTDTNPFSIVSGSDLWGASPAVADLDGDADLDVYIGTYYYSHFYNDTPYHGQMLQYRRDGPGDFAVSVGGSNPLSTLPRISSFIFFPVFADIDGDGDTDFYVNRRGDGYDYIDLFRNTGTATAPAFELSAAENPFDYQVHPEFEFGEYPALAFVDIDNDGDLDAFVGQEYYGYASVRFLENTGTPTAPTFVERTGEGNPLSVFTGTDITDYPAPAFVDFDEDGDMDAFVGGGSYVGSPTYAWEGRIQYFKNTTPVVVTAASQAATDAAGQTVSASSNKFAGWVYVVLDGTPQATVAELEVAIAQHKAAKAAVIAANADVQISTVSLVAGTYYAYAVSGGADPGLSAKGTGALVISASVVPPVVVPYPASEGLDSSDVWIQKVTIGSLVNDSGYDAGYGDFTGSAATLARGASVTIDVVPGFKPEARYSIRRLAQQIWRVWVDWNHDGDFADADEEVFAGGPSQHALSATITVPQAALLGSTRIRVSMRYAGDGAPLAEGTFAHGEVEDYTGTVTE